MFDAEQLGKVALRGPLTPTPAPHVALRGPLTPTPAPHVALRGPLTPHCLAIIRCLGRGPMLPLRDLVDERTEEPLLDGIVDKTHWLDLGRSHTVFVSHHLAVEDVRLGLVEDELKR